MGLGRRRSPIPGYIHGDAQLGTTAPSGTITHDMPYATTPITLPGIHVTQSVGG